MRPRPIETASLSSILSKYLTSSSVYDSYLTQLPSRQIPAVTAEILVLLEGAQQQLIISSSGKDRSSQKFRHLCCRRVFFFCKQKMFTYLSVCPTNQKAKFRNTPGKGYFCSGDEWSEEIEPCELEPELCLARNPIGQPETHRNRVLRKMVTQTYFDVASSNLNLVRLKILLIS